VWRRVERNANAVQQGDVAFLVYLASGTLQHIIQRLTQSIADCGKKIAAIKQSTMLSTGMMIGVSWCSSLCGDV
jgi:hypothetical protein